MLWEILIWQGVTMMAIFFLELCILIWAFLARRRGESNPLSLSLEKFNQWVPFLSFLFFPFLSFPFLSFPFLSSPFFDFGVLYLLNFFIFFFSFLFFSFLFFSFLFFRLNYADLLGINIDTHITSLFFFFFFLPIPPSKIYLNHIN